MHSNLKNVSPDLTALYEPLFLEMKKYAEGKLDDLDDSNAYRYFKMIAGNCNKKAIPKEVYYPLAIKHLDFKTYKDEATEATEEAYQYESDWAIWLKVREKVGDPNNPSHMKGNRKASPKPAKPSEQLVALSKEELEGICDVRSVIMDYLPFLCFNERLEKYSFIFFSFLSHPKTMEEIMDFGESIGVNNEEADFIFGHIQELGVTDFDETTECYSQKTLTQLIS
ncbi:MAG: hypothetical protein WC756_06615 [Taibaiella sp.]|jgi:hypothetical protein